MPWTGDVISGVNEILKNVDMSGVTDLRVYKNPFLARLEREYSHDNFYTGAGARMSLKATVPMNARPRVDAQDVPLPTPHRFTRMTVNLAEYVASTGITIKEQEVAKRSKTAVANLADIKLEDLKDDLRFRLNNAARGDGTGRLGYVGSVANDAGGAAGSGTGGTPWHVTLGNTGVNFGWGGADRFEVGMFVDIVEPDTPGSTSGWNVRATNLQVTSVDYATGVVVLSALTQNGVAISTVVDTSNMNTKGNYGNLANDMIVSAGALTFTGTSSAGISTWNEMNGLLALVDNGASTFNDTAGTGTGCYRGTYFQGIADRTTMPQLCSKVYNKWSGTSPGSWDLEDILKPIRDVDFGYSGGQTTALYVHPDMQAAIARKAYQANNALQNVTDNKVTGGYYTKTLVTSTGRSVPIIPMQGHPLNTIIGVCEDDYKVVMPNEIGFVNPYSPGGGGDPFFAAPGSRNLTYEAWLRCELNVVAERCDNSFRIEGLTTLE